MTFAAVGLPVLRTAKVAGDGAGGGSVVFRQTAGGRTAIPLPRPVPHPPFVRWQAPLVWTTLALTIRADGSSQARMVGASAFPRHWVYGSDGEVAWKSALTDESGWMRHSFGDERRGADRDREAFVTEVESQTERQLSAEIMRGGARPEVRRLPDGALLTRQGDPGDELYLILDGVAVVEVDGLVVAELGPGAVVGERAILEEGLRTSTVRATTPLRVAVARRAAIDVEQAGARWRRRTAARTSRWGRRRPPRSTDRSPLGRGRLMCVAQLRYRDPPPAAVPGGQRHHAGPVDQDAHQHGHDHDLADELVVGRVQLDVRQQPEGDGGPAAAPRGLTQPRNRRSPARCWCEPVTAPPGRSGRRPRPGRRRPRSPSRSRRRASG